ncbi:MAG: hypothetical protein IPL49_07085 [Saprospirales bacterium]|nr:hypothetical protein [Saprospirales bacterium]
MNSTTQIEHIAEKINRLAVLLDRLRKENEALEKENAQLKKQSANFVIRINVLEQELDNKQADWAEREKNRAVQSEQLKKQIDSHIQEIDRCIEWLQNE